MIQNRRVEYSVICSSARSLVRSHHSLIRLLRTGRFARSLCCAHSLAPLCSFARLLQCSLLADVVPTVLLTYKFERSIRSQKFYRFPSYNVFKGSFIGNRHTDVKSKVSRFGSFPSKGAHMHMHGGLVKPVIRT